MAVRQLVDDSHPADADAGAVLACPISPRCQSAARLGGRYSLAAGTVLVHAHLAIDHATTTVSMHPLVVPPPGGYTPMCPAYDTVERERRAPGPVIARMQTSAAHRGFDGFHLDLVGLQRHPREIATRAVILPGRVGIVRTLWLLHGMAWKRAPGPSAIWTAPSDGRELRVRWDFGDGRSSAEKIHELQRCEDLLLGRSSKVGRRSRVESAGWRNVAERAEALKAEDPDRSYREIAETLMVGERTLRDYRADLRREREGGHPTDVPMILACPAHPAPDHRGD